MVSTKIIAILNIYDTGHSEFSFPSLEISNNKHTQLEIQTMLFPQCHISYAEMTLPCTSCWYRYKCPRSPVFPM